MMATRVWEQNIRKLKVYYEEHGNFFVPVGWRKDLRFALWVENVRKSPGSLPPDLQNALKKIGFSLSSSSDWNVMFSKLAAFYKKYGHSHVPSNQKKFEELFDWTVNQRRARSLLTSKQVKALNSLDFDWTLSVQGELRWENKYRELVLFKRKYGHTKVPQDFKENKALGRWVSMQRRYKTKKKLREDRIRRLNEIGFLWKEDISRLYENAWEKRYNELLRYKKSNGHIDRIKIRREHLHLGIWMDSQIALKDTLPLHRRKKLNAIGFKWDKGNFHDDLWNEMYQWLKAYEKENGHCRVKKTEDFKLYTWLNKNKTERKTIRRDRRQKLEALGVDLFYNHNTATWESMYNRLKEFKRKHGHVMVTSSKNAPESIRHLYYWLQDQMYLRKRNELSKERERNLRQLDSLWYLPNNERRWHQKLREFKDFKSKNKNYPGWDSSLRRWIHWQKTIFKTLPREKKELLLKAGVINK